MACWICLVWVGRTWVVQIFHVAFTSLFLNIVSEQYWEISVRSVGWNFGSLQVFNLAILLFSNTPHFLKLDTSLRAILWAMLDKLHTVRLIFQKHFHSNPIHPISNEHALCTNYDHLLTDPRTTGISHFKEKGVITLKPAPRHLHWFLFKHLSKESLQFCPTDLFQRTQSKVNYAASQVPELHSNQLILCECSWNPKKSPSKLSPRYKISTRGLRFVIDHSHLLC